MEINTDSKPIHNHLRNAPILVAHQALKISSTFVIKIVSITKLTMFREPLNN